MPVSIAFVFQCVAAFVQSAHELRPWELAFHTTAPRPTIACGGVDFVMCVGKRSTKNKESVTFPPYPSWIFVLMYIRKHSTKNKK